MASPHVVLIGAGSASFGVNTLAALMRSSHLRGGRIALVDNNPDSLARVARLAERLNHEWRCGVRVDATTDRAQALDGAGFVILAIEVPPREALWQSDFEIPLRFGVRQPYAENGGPGGFAHAARNIGPVMAIARDMERLCPDAWLINFTNPMIRICDAVARYSRIRVVGLCHQIYMGYAMAGRALASDLGLEVPPEFTDTHASPATIPAQVRMADQAVSRLTIRAAGLNHFTWMLELRDAATGEDLYPLFARRWAELDANFEPLTRRVYDAFGLFPIPGDSHLCEYLPWLSNADTKPWEKYNVRLYDFDQWDALRLEGHQRVQRMADGTDSLEPLQKTSGEGTVEIIEAIAGAGRRDALALNLPNRGAIANLPDGAIVETPGWIDAAGVHATPVGPLPEAIAELCRRETTVARLCVDAAVTGDRQAALQCLLLDPIIGDMDVAKQVLEAYLEAYRGYLPQFWV